jgi:hypothetical protein
LARFIYRKVCRLPLPAVSVSNASENRIWAGSPNLAIFFAAMNADTNRAIASQMRAARRLIPNVTGPLVKTYFIATVPAMLPLLIGDAWLLGER